MKFYGIIFLSYLLSNSVVKCEQPSLIASYFMPSESYYQVFLSAKHLSENSVVNISLKADGYEEALVRHSGDSTDKPLKFTLPNEQHLSYQLKLKYYDDFNNEYSCEQQSVKLINMAKRPIILIQSDKPAYNLGDEIKFRIFVLSQKLVPFDKIDEMNVVIFDGAQKIVKELNHLETSEFGFYEDSTKIPDTSKLGKWKIEVEVNGRKISKSFDVEKLDKNSLQAILITDDEVASSDQKINFGINVKHPIDKFFFGIAKISFSRGNMRNVKKRLIKTLKLTTQYTTVQLDIEDDLGITIIRSDMDLNFDIEIIDYTGKLKTLISKTIVLKNNNHKISTFEKSYFIPGIEFPVKIEVRKLSGQLDNSYETLQVTVEYENDNDSIEDDYQVDLDNGRKTINLKPSKDTKEIKLKLTFGEVEMEKVIKSSTQLGISHFILGSFVNEKKDYQIDDTAIISAKISEEIEEVNILVFGPNGIVHSEILKQEQLIDELTFEIKVTESMIPQSNVIFYYVREDGTVVHDYLTLNVGFPTKNQLQLSMPQNANGKEPVSINIKTEENSMIFLTATDSIQEQNNEISMRMIHDSFPQSSFKVNSNNKNNLGIYGAFVLKSSESSQCDDHNDQLDSEFADIFENLSTDTEILAHKFIPSIWFDDKNLIDGPEKVIEKMSLNSPGVWRVQGVAMHPTKGLTFTNTQPIITISKKSSLLAKGPPSVKENEVFVIECIVVNLNENDRDILVKINIENGEILDEKTEKVQRNPIESSKLLKFKDTRSITSNFLVRAKAKGLLKVKATTEDEKSEFSIKVKSVKVLSKIVSSMELTAIAENGKKERIVIKSEASKPGYFKRTYDNLLGLAVEGLDKLFNPQYNLTEFKVDSLATWVISCRHQKTVSCITKLNESYNAVAIDLLPIIKQKNPSNIRLIAHAAETLTDALEFIEVDLDLFYECLDFIKYHQKRDGSFPYDENLNLRRGLGSPKFQQVLLVTKVLQAFKDSEVKEQYKDEVKKSIEYLTISKKLFKNDYEKILAAYSFAIHGDLESARDLIYKISCNFLTRTLYSKHKSMFVEIASYTILTKVLLNADAKNEVRWLMSQRNADGGFYSPHDTVLGLRALYEFSKYAKETGLMSINDTQNNKMACNTLNIPQTNLDYEDPEGHGSIPYNLTYSIIYQETDMISNSKFFKTCAEMKAINVNSIKINLSIEFNPSEQIVVSNLVVAEIRLPTGYEFIKKDGFNNLKLEPQDDGNLVLMYIDKMTKGQTFSFGIDAKKIYGISSYSNSYIKVYDYYQPNFIDVNYYQSNSKCSKPIEIRDRVRQRT